MKLALLIFLSISGVFPVKAQWQKVADQFFFPYNNGYNYGGALIHQDGIVWGGNSTLFQSLDSGKTWTPNTLNITSFIMSIDFLDRNHGIVAQMYSGVHITTDGGKTWSLRATPGECLAGAFGSTPQTIVLALRTTSPPYYGYISVTTDGGGTWRDLKVETGGGAYHVTRGSKGRIYVLARTFNNGPRKSIVYYSDDDGVTWNKRGYSLDLDCYSMAVSYCDDETIFVVNEDHNETPDQRSQIYRSSDGGQTFKTVFSEQAAFLTGFLVVSRNALYTQSYASTILRSTDVGTSWEYIGGPNNYHDTRMLCAIDDNLLLASDIQGNIWRTTNSGGDSVKPVPGKVTVRLSSPASVIDPTPGAEIAVPISLKNATAQVGFDLVIRYDRRGFEYLGTFAKNGDRIDDTSLSSPGRSIARFRSTDITLGTAMIGYSLFKIKWPEIYCNTLYMDTVLSNGSPCSPAIDWTPTETIVGNYNGCLMSAPDAVSDEFRFTVHPNPSHGVFILSSSEEAPNTSIIVLDELGRVVYDVVADISPDNASTIDLSAKPEGTYFVRLQHGSYARTIQVIKL